MIRVSEIFELTIVTDDPRFEGFALAQSKSVLGRDSLDDDLTPGFVEAEKNTNWRQVKLGAKWKPPKVEGRVAEFNDFPGIDMVLPAFSQRAVDALKDLLEPNGEILPLRSNTKTKFYFYNILNIANVLNKSRSVCEFWCRPPTTAVDIEHFEFHKNKVQELSIFRIPQLPVYTFVTNVFVDRVNACGLTGFDFTKVWPLPKSVDWRMQGKKAWKKRMQLKKETVVVRLPLSGSAGERQKIRRLEKTFDETLLPSDMTKYVGVYEGSDEVDNEFRMYFSCPNAKKLFNQIQGKIEQLSWHCEVCV